MFPLNRYKRIIDVAESVKKWLVGSWHYYLSEANLDGLEHSGFEYQNQICILRTIAYADNKKVLWSLQHESHQENARYLTEITAKEDDSGLSAIVSLDYGGPIRHFEVRKPRIIPFLINEVGGDYDGNLTISSNPIIPTKEDVQFIADILVKNRGNKLPVVYVTIGRNGEYPVDLNRLANELAGEGHVVVEPNREFNLIMWRLIGNQNPYNGAIAIFLPDKDETDRFRQIRLLPEKTDDMHDVTISKVRQLSLFRFIPPELSFHGIEHILFMENMRKLKENTDQLKKTGTSIEEYIDMLDQSFNDNSRLVEENRRLVRQVEQLMIAQQYCQENNLVRSREYTDDDLLSINQQELYPGEIHDFLLSCLEIALRSMPPDTRRYDLINEILETNTKTDNKKPIVDGIEEALNQGPIDLLRRLGFVIKYGGKHPILSLPFYSRSMPIPSTPGGGRRSEENTIAQIKRLFLV